MGYDPNDCVNNWIGKTNENGAATLEKKYGPPLDFVGSYFYEQLYNQSSQRLDQTAMMDSQRNPRAAKIQEQQEVIAKQDLEIERLKRDLGFRLESYVRRDKQAAEKEKELSQCILDHVDALKLILKFIAEDPKRQAAYDQFMDKCHSKKTINEAIAAFNPKHPHATWNSIVNVENGE